MRWLAVLSVLVVSAPALARDPGPVDLTADQRRERAVLIRDTAAGVGMTNAALLAGIGEVETNFAHCWSEATWACKGPNSPSCGNGPVIAGSADGACSAQQGGLGMFQFDAGTYSQTIAQYGDDIVTMEGNVDAVVPFLVTRAIQSIDGVNNEEEALAWMNSITIENGDEQYERWVYFVAWRYNGCMGCTAQINKYRNGTNKLYAEFGADFWKITPDPVEPEPEPMDPTDPEPMDPTDPGDDGESINPESDGGCSTDGTPGFGLLLVLGAFLGRSYRRFDRR